MGMTFFNRRPEVRDVIVDYFIKNNLQYSIMNGKFYFIYPNGIPKRI